MVVGAARLAAAGLDCGCPDCGADAGCWATAVMVAVNRTKASQFMLLIYLPINFRILSSPMLQYVL